MQAQTYPNIEHMIVSDGPDPELSQALPDSPGRYFFQLAERDPEPHWGHHARLFGLKYASGELIAYLDDDDAFRPEHCTKLAEALRKNPEAGWAVSLMASHRPAADTDAVTEIGHGEPSAGNVGTPMIMHRREILEHGTWGPPSSLEDWELVNRWIHAGIGYVQVPEVTVDVWPSLYFGPGS